MISQRESGTIKLLKIYSKIWHLLYLGLLGLFLSTKTFRQFFLAQILNYQLMIKQILNYNHQFKCQSEMCSIWARS